MRVLVTGGEQDQAARIASALLAGGMELAVPGDAYDLQLTLSAHRPERMRRGALLIDLARRRAFAGGTPLVLTPLEFALLAYLAQAQGRVSRAELLRELWGYRYDPGTNSVAVHISRLRGKLGRGAILTEGGWLSALRGWVGGGPSPQPLSPPRPKMSLAKMVRLCGWRP